MNTIEHTGARLVKGSAVVSNRPYLLYGFVVIASVDGGSATLYARQDAVSEASLGTYPALANSPTVVMLPRPALLDLGLYVSVGANVAGVLIVGEPL